MEKFEYFLETKEVRKELSNIALAHSLIKDMEERIKKSISLDIKIFSKIIFENFYDAIQDFCNALLAIDGYKSYSHIASIAYLSKYGFNDYEISILDNFRLRRHGSKYYGVEISSEETEEIIKFYNRIKSLITKLIKSKLNQNL